MIAPHPVRTLFRAATALVVIAMVSVLLLEGLVRLVLPQPQPALWLQPDARYGHVMKADYEQDYAFAGSDVVMHVRTNSRGFRDEEPGAATEAAVVVFAGDSFTFGHGVQVEERFDTLLGARLRAAGTSASLVNVGVNAWGTLQTVSYLEDHLAQLDPDIVVLTFCENDPFDDSYYLEHGISFDRVRFPGKNWLRAHSHVFRLLQEQYLLFRKRQTLAAQAAPAAAPVAAPLEQAHAAPPIGVAEWERTSGYLREFADALTSWKPTARLVLQASSPWDTAIAEQLRGIAAGHPAISYVPLDALAALPESERRLPYDGHWSRRAHELVAEALQVHLTPLLTAP